MDYKTSGVDIEAGRKFVSQIKKTVEATHSKNVIGGLGGFGGLFKLLLGIIQIQYWTQEPME